MRASAVDAAFAREWTPLVAALARRFGDLGLAEDSAAEAFAEAARTWGDTPPERPGAWLQTVARRRAVDVLRHREGFAARAPLLVASTEGPPSEASAVDDDPVDDQLALVFGCCHPAVSMDARVALTLRAVHGLSTAQIADAFLVGHETMTRRLHRARTKVRDGGIGFRIPEREHWPRRVDAVLRVVYVVFTAGHTATRSAALVRGDLCDEAPLARRSAVRPAGGRGGGDRARRTAGPDRRPPSGARRRRRRGRAARGPGPLAVGPPAGRVRPGSAALRAPTAADRSVPAPGHGGRDACARGQLAGHRLGDDRRGVRAARGPWTPRPSWP